MRIVYKYMGVHYTRVRKYKGKGGYSEEGLKIYKGEGGRGVADLLGKKHYFLSIS